MNGRLNLFQSSLSNQNIILSIQTTFDLCIIKLKCHPFAVSVEPNQSRFEWWQIRKQNLEICIDFYGLTQQKNIIFELSSYLKQLPLEQIQSDPWTNTVWVSSFDSQKAKQLLWEFIGCK